MSVGAICLGGRWLMACFLCGEIECDGERENLSSEVEREVWSCETALNPFRRLVRLLVQHKAERADASPTLAERFPAKHDSPLF